MPPTHAGRILVITLTIVLSFGFLPGIATAKPANNSCDDRQLTTTQQFLQCVDAEAAFEHLEAFQSFADEGDGSRASGTSGYDASADYVAELLESAGLIVERQRFDFSHFEELSASVTIDGSAVDPHAATYSASGSVIDGNVVAVNLDLGPGNSSTSACRPEDFDGLDFSGDRDIALTQRGGCTFADKAVNAVNAGAEAVVIFNQGDTDDRTGTIDVTLGDGVVDLVDVPVLDLAYADGIAMIDATEVSVAVETKITIISTENVIADLPGINPDNVVMAGAHLDSVADGPGIQDNAGASSALLTIALALATNEDYLPQNTLRFAWWGAEEAGLIGSENYVFNPDFGLTDEEYFALALYLNFDMIASPNFIYGVYDGDESSFDASVPVPEGSAALEDLFEAYYSANGIPYEDSEFSGRSDYQAFINVDIPASGLFTGAEGIKSDEQQRIWGGVAGEPFDGCYHTACDTIDNVSAEALDVNIDAMGWAIFQLAASTEAVNGVAANGVAVNGLAGDSAAADVELDGPRRTVLAGGGGLGRHSHAID